MPALDVFKRFLLLGCVSFGGPAAHIAYFQKAFVEKHEWLSQNEYSKLVALSQFLPGPGSSQVGFALGVRQAGLAGGLAAFAGFTLPSFLLMLALASGASVSAWQPVLSGLIDGLKLLAVVVVADAIITMYTAFCKRWQASLIAVLTAAILILAPSLWLQMLMLGAAGLAGVVLDNGVAEAQKRSGPLNIGWIPLILFAVLFIGAPLLASDSEQPFSSGLYSSSGLLTLFSDFYYAGSLVFGGGHVVLPLLQSSVGDAMSNDQFLTGYAAAQAVPGPMFTLATFLGASISEQALLGALIATLAIFTPGFLLVLALQNGWQTLLDRPAIRGVSWGVNAAVVGLLAAAFYQPVLVSAVHDFGSAALCIIGLLALRLFKCPILILVITFGGIGYFI